MELYVGNLAHFTTEKELRNLFAEHGKVAQVRIVTDHYTRQSKCFGYVQMDRSKEAEHAMKMLHGTTVNERRLEIRKARSVFERQGSPW